MVPTKERNHYSAFVSYKNEGFLVDCGEGTQRQMKIAGIPLTKITKILISHWHGDHVFGLPGLLTSLGATGHEKEIQLFGPEGTSQKMKKLIKLFGIEYGLNLVVKEITEKKFYDGKDFYLEAYPLQHNIPCFGYNIIEKDTRKIKMNKLQERNVPEGPWIGKLQQGKNITYNGETIHFEDVTTMKKGKKISFVMDTGFCENAIKLSKNADVVICEASFDSSLEDKAIERNHLTAKQAGQIASSAGAKKLVLTHFSARYKNTQELEEDARVVFDNTIAAEDFMKIVV
jgi:ribonuclease Z